MLNTKTKGIAQPQQHDTDTRKVAPGTKADNSANASVNSEAKRADHTGTSDNGAQPRRNTVETVLSKSAVTSLEIVVDQFWNRLDGVCYVDNLMRMLSVYVEYRPDIPTYTQPDEMVLFVSKIIELCNDMKSIVDEERPDCWESVYDGYCLPVSDNQSGGSNE